MNLEQRLRAWHETLPDEGGIVLSRDAIGSLLGVEPSSAEGREQDLTTEEMADRYRVTPGTILRWLHTGYFGRVGEGWYRLGRRYYIRQAPGALPSHRGRSAGTDLRLPRTR